MNRPSSLLIVSHVRHYRWQGTLHAYGPYTREINVWATLFDDIVIASPCRLERPPSDTSPIASSNVRIYAITETGGTTWTAKLYQVAMLPILVVSLMRAMQRPSAIHVRCPGNLGLLGAILAPLFSDRRIAKYAGQWTNYPGEPWTVKLQRRILQSRWWGAPVTVYGDWPNQPSHIIPFFTSVLDDAHLNRARRLPARTECRQPLRLLYVGRLSPAKNVDCVIRAVDNVTRRGYAIELTVVGDGENRSTLETLVSTLSVRNRVTFTGAISFDMVLDKYENHDVLVLVSESEGWPKAIAEAMAFGVVCIGSRRGLIPWMLQDGRGLLVDPGDAANLANTLMTLMDTPNSYEAMSANAAEWGQQFSLQTLRTRLSQLLDEQWGTDDHT